MGISTDEEDALARILARVNRSALEKQCAAAFNAEVRDAHLSLQQAREAVRALRELESAARYLRDQRRVDGVASITSGALLSTCKQVVAFNSQVAEALDRAVGGSKAFGLYAVESEASNSVLQTDNGQKGADGADMLPIAVTTTSKKRKLSDTSGASIGEASVTSDEDTAQKTACTPDRAAEDMKPVVPNASPRKPTAVVDASVDFDPNESPVELPVPDSDDSDSETRLTAPRSSCLESAQRLQRGIEANQLSRFPALIQQLQSYVQAHRRDLGSADKAQEFAEAVAIAIRIGMKLQFLPSVRDALASLLMTVEKLEQAVDPLPSPLNEDVEKLSLYFLRLTRPQTHSGGDRE